MHDDFPSVTAMLVAFARGFSGSAREQSRDPLAERMLPEPLRSTLVVARRASEGRPAVERLISLATLDTLAHAGLRTDAIDAAISDAVNSGAKQLVIVGAGLDARAYRLDFLRDVAVFEVDHPATQRLKKKNVASLTPRSKSLVHVAVDFGRDSLDDALARAGHDATARTVFVWEGVTMYLPREAMRATLAVLRARSTPGSRLVLTYVDPGFSSLPEILIPTIRRVFALAGEPVIGDIATAEMHDELLREHFRVRSDTSSRDWEQTSRYGERPLVHLHERVIDAERF